MNNLQNLDNFKTKPKWKYIKLSIENTIHMELKNWIEIELNWSKQIIKI